MELLPEKYLTQIEETRDKELYRARVQAMVVSGYLLTEQKGCELADIFYKKFALFIDTLLLLITREQYHGLIDEDIGMVLFPIYGNFLALNSETETQKKGDG